MAPKYLTQKSASSQKTRWADKVINVNPASGKYFVLFLVVFIVLNVFALILRKHGVFVIPFYAAAFIGFNYLAFFADRAKSNTQDSTNGIRILMFIFGATMTALCTLTFAAQFISGEVAGALAGVTILSLFVGVAICAVAYPDFAERTKQSNNYKPFQDSQQRVDFYDPTSRFYNPLDR